MSNNSVFNTIYNKLYEKFPSAVESIHIKVIQASSIIESYKKSHIYIIFSCILVVLLLASHTHYYLHSYNGKDSYIGNASESKQSIYYNLQNLTKSSDANDPIVIKILFWILYAAFNIFQYTLGIVIKILHIILLNCIHINIANWQYNDNKNIIPNAILHIIINILNMMLYTLLIYLVIILINMMLISVINSIMKLIITKNIIKNKYWSTIIICCLFPYLLYMCYVVTSTINWSIFFKKLSYSQLTLKNMPLVTRCNYISKNIDNKNVAIIAQILFTIFIDPVILFFQCIWYIISLQLISPNVGGGVANIINNILLFVIQWAVRLVIMILFGVCCIVYQNSAQYIQEEHQTDIITVINFNSKNGINLYKKQQHQSKVPITV